MLTKTKSILDFRSSTLIGLDEQKEPSHATVPLKFNTFKKKSNERNHNSKWEGTGAVRSFQKILMPYMVPVLSVFNYFHQELI